MTFRNFGITKFYTIFIRYSSATYFTDFCTDQPIPNPYLGMPLTTNKEARTAEIREILIYLENCIPENVPHIFW